MRPSLTFKESEVYNFIKLFWEREGPCPSTKEIADGRIKDEQIMVTRKSKNTGWVIVKQLVGKHYLTEHYHNDRTYWRVV